MPPVFFHNHLKRLTSVVNTFKGACNTAIEAKRFGLVSVKIDPSPHNNEAALSTTILGRRLQSQYAYEDADGVRTTTFANNLSRR